MIGSMGDEILGWLSNPGAFWFIYGIILFWAFLLFVGTVENLILKKSINAFVMGGLLAAYVYFGIHWGRSIAPGSSVQAWQFGVAPSSEGICPASDPIKAALNTTGANRCTYYFPGADYYNQTRPDRCYARREQAMADGCAQSKF